MNDARRKRLKEAKALLEQAQSIISDVSSEETDAHQSISERFPGSQQETDLSESASSLEELDEALTEMIETVGSFEK